MKKTTVEFTAKMTQVEADWDDQGARIFTTNNTFIFSECPRCNTPLENGKEHLCGNRVPNSAGKKKGKRVNR